MTRGPVEERSPMNGGHSPVKDSPRRESSKTSEGNEGKRSQAKKRQEKCMTEKQNHHLDRYPCSSFRGREETRMRTRIKRREVRTELTQTVLLSIVMRRQQCPLPLCSILLREAGSGSFCGSVFASFFASVFGSLLPLLPQDLLSLFHPFFL